MESKGDILVVDDVPANLRLLVDMLKDCGYKARAAPSGELALKAVAVRKPDLILLDITMPEMDGFEVIQRLKDDPDTRDIPVIFISALGEAADKVAAFRTGGVDYVSKPFQCEEVEARVRLHLELRRQGIALQERFEQLKELERLRDELTHMIAHDMRSPLLGLQLSIELLETVPLDSEKGKQVLKGAQRSVATLVDMINQMIDVSRMESGNLAIKKVDTDMALIVEDVISRFRALAGSKSLAFEHSGPIRAQVDMDLIRRVIENLVANALKFSPDDGSVTVRCRTGDGEIRVEVEDNGIGIALDKHELVFRKYGQVEGAQRKKGSGLGLAFAKLAVEAHGGAIGLESDIGKGCVFWFTLPEN